MSIFTAQDARNLRYSQLLQLLQTYFPGVQISDSQLLSTLQAAEKDIAHRLRIYLEPTQVFAMPPLQADIDALPAGMPWEEESAYDYDAGFFQENRWGYIVTRKHPIISVSSLSFNYPAPTSTIFPVPLDWIRLDKKFGHIRLVPATSQFTAPLGVFLLQALGGGGTIPAMIQLKHVAGLADAKADYPDLIDTIYKRAALMLMEGGFFAQSESISGDGLSQSRSIDMNRYYDMIEGRLFGPKGSNGGFWTLFHGVGGGVFGPTN